MNQAEHAVQSSQNISENLMASRSRILDADYAVESAQLAKSNILQQAEMAMIKQANMQTERTLSLLRTIH